MSDRAGAAAARPRDFEPVESAAEADKMILEASKTLASTFVWTQEPSKVTVTTHIHLVDAERRTFTLLLPKDFDPKNLINALAESATPECLFSISLTRANIFFKAKFKNHDSIGMHFNYPESVFKVQRRKDMRLTVPDGHVMRVEFPSPENGKMLSKKLLDLSASGLAFVADEGEQELFAAGKTLTKLSILVQSRKIEIPEAEIRHSRSLSKDNRMPGYKVGILFKNIKAGDSQVIAQYVFEESRRYFARFM